MASTDVTKVLPNTEAMRDAIELLNGMDADSFAAAAQRVVEGIRNQSNTTTTTDAKANAVLVAQEAAIRFIVYQLTYFSINKHATAVEALTEPITSSASVESTSLNADKAEALAGLWVESGKDIVQQARINIIRKVCAGSNAASAAIAYGNANQLSSSTHREPHIHCSTAIKMGEGDVLEVQAATAEGQMQINRTAQSMDFTPLASLTLPGGATVEMTEEQAYELFSELDAIQRQMDTLFASA